MAFANREFEPAFRLGERIAERYEVGRVLVGGMGAVYVVYDHQNRDVLALKTFQNRPTENSAEERALERALHKEASAWIALDRHPFIVRAHWVQEFHGRLFIAMDYIAPDGRRRNTLRHYLEGQPLPLDQVLRWGIEFCHGMEHAFGKGLLCHRDIKPDNILITRDGHVKITDFGLAGALDHGPQPESLKAPRANAGDLHGGGLTVMRVGKGQVGGTPGYIAPEVLRGEGADIRSDVFSFGIVLYQMVTGNPAFGELQVGPSAPVDILLWPVIERCLLAQARSRYSSFGSLRGELEGLARKVGGVRVATPEVTELEVWEWNNKGMSLSALGRKEEALVQFNRALEIAPTDAVVLSNKGATLSELGRHEDAVLTCDRALEIDRQYANAWNNKGNALLGLGRKDQAIAYFDHALQIDPKHTPAWSNKGIALFELGRLGEAIACYDRALEITPGDEQFWNNRGNALSDLGRKLEAIDNYDRALKINPRYALALYNKGKVLSNLGYKREALTHYDQSLDIDPGYIRAWNNRGLALSALGRKGDAIASFDRALAINRRFAAGWYNRGNVLSDLERHEEAIGSYDHALEVDPTHLLAWNNRGLSLSALGRNEEAIASYDCTLGMDPNHLLALCNKGNALCALGRTREAIAYFDRALETNPGDTDALWNKATALAAIGRKQQAVEAYRCFIIHAPTSHQRYVKLAQQLIAKLEAGPGEPN